MGEGEETEEESSSASADSESAPEVEPTAGMTFTLMDVLLRQIEFFRGSAGLMSAAWNAPSELTSALQVKREFLKFNILIIDVTECIVYMFRPIPFNLFFPVLFLFDWVGFLWPNYLRC